MGTLEWAKHFSHSEKSNIQFLLHYAPESKEYLLNKKFYQRNFSLIKIT